MSTLKVSEIRNASSATGGLSIAADGVVSGALPYPNRNLLHNGAMQVAQRGTSETGITASGYYTADRWNLFYSGLGTWTQTVEADGPTGSGFTKSLKMECTTADASPAAGDALTVQQRLEGQDLQRIRKGTSDALPITLSFWVKSNVTGTYIVELYDTINTRQVSASYTISSSGTWEKKTLTYAGDTTGALTNSNIAALYLNWFLGSGTDRAGGTLNTSWAAVTSANRAAGQTNLAASTSNYWQITGVQLEVGDTATEFEFKSFGQELRECQRYFERYSGYYNFPQSPAPVDVTNRGECHLYYSEKRANPSVTLSSTSHFTVVALTASYVANATSFGMSTGTGRRSGNMFFGVPATLNVNTPCDVYINDPAGYIDISAEL